jgi:hypothetical protein
MASQIDLESDLRSRFPAAFQAPPHFRYDCGEGWFAIVETLCTLLSHANERGGHAPTYLAEAVEKMGTLRVLVAGRDSRTNEWITFAEQHAARTCEICGASGRLLYADGWQRVRCQLHAQTARPLSEGE